MTDTEKQNLKHAIEVEIRGSFMPNLDMALGVFENIYRNSAQFAAFMNELTGRQDSEAHFKFDLCDKLAEALINNLQLRVELIGKQNGINERHKTDGIGHIST